MEPHEQTYQEYWKPLVEKPDGSLNLDAVKRELHDYHTALCEVSKAYWHLTNGRFSKPNTMHEYIVAAVEESYRRDDEEVAAEARAEGRREGFKAARAKVPYNLNDPEGKNPNGVFGFALGFRDRFATVEDYERSIKEEHGS